jgi:hypothetical protein
VIHAHAVNVAYLAAKKQVTKVLVDDLRESQQNETAPLDLNLGKNMGCRIANGKIKEYTR